MRGIRGVEVCTGINRRSVQYNKTGQNRHTVREDMATNVGHVPKYPGGLHCSETRGVGLLLALYTTDTLELPNHHIILLLLY